MTSIETGRTPQPRFAREMAEKYRGGAIVEFLLHGNVADLQPLYQPDGTLKWVALREYFSKVLFAGRDMILFYDEAAGISFANPDMGNAYLRVQQAAALIGGWKNEPKLPRDPLGALQSIGNYLRAAALDPRDPKRVALVIDFAQTVVPAGEVGSLGADEQACLVTLL